MEPLVKKFLSNDSDKALALVCKLRPVRARGYLTPSELEAVCRLKAPRAPTGTCEGCGRPELGYADPVRRLAPGLPESRLQLFCEETPCLACSRLPGRYYERPHSVQHSAGRATPTDLQPWTRCGGPEACLAG